jgi:endonuclease/exonuclease/phosphatase family metal-dependent hydrolase
MAIFMVCGSLISHAETDMYFVNKTPYTLTVAYSSAKNPSDADLNDFQTGPQSIAPNARVKLMSVPRGGMPLDPSADYYFTATISGLPDNKKVACSLYVRTSPIHGAGKTSSIKATTYLVGENPTWYDSNLTRFFSSDQKIGGKTFTSYFKWIGLHLGSIYEDIEYTLTETGTITDAKKLTLLQYNIQQRPTSEGMQYQTLGTHSERSQLSTIALPAAIKQFNADVVTVNEAFTKALRPPLQSEMRKAGFTYATDAVNANSSSFWSGGVMVFSKYPFTKTAEYTFGDSAAADSSAAKGAWYVQIKKTVGNDSMFYNIFATHTNASYTFKGKTRLAMDDAGRGARKVQFKELKKFIDDQKIPKDQPVIIVGDMNVDMISEKGQPGDEYAYMLAALNATHPPIVGPVYTFNQYVNEWVDPDDGPIQYLDYALIENAHLKPTSAEIETICLKSDGSNDCTQKGSAKLGKRDLSDHFPILCKFDFNPAPSKGAGG